MTGAETLGAERPPAAGGGVRRKLAWRPARVVDLVAETRTARTLVFDVDAWSGHTAGQHVDVRLTADDGYQATRSYSLSSGPTEPPQITVERVEDGEVSPYLVDVVERGDEIELRGPIGGYFVWEPVASALLLVGGGSGIAPLRAMWRARTGATGTTVVYSAQSEDRVIFADELAALEDTDVRIHLTRETRPGYASGRLEADDLASVVGAGEAPAVFVCGPTGFVETVSGHLVDLDVEPRTIRTERFG
jgi:ferredoxin-NADP reductase